MVRSAAVVGLGLLLAGWSPALVQARVERAPVRTVAEEDEPKPSEDRLLEIGKEAPDFTLPLVDGGEATLFNLLKGSKAVLVVFWGIEPQHGGEEMPKLQKLHEKLESKKLITIAVNPRDDLDDVKDFVTMSKLHYLVAIDGKETNRAVTGVYKARKLPTLYVLDPEGKVRYRSIGYKEPALREALEKLGLK